MDEIPLSVLFSTLAFLILLSGFFSSSETGLMTLNRYRLRHLTKVGHSGAIRASQLLEKPDRLIGLILLGNNFVNILASSLATIIAIRLAREWQVDTEGAIAIAAITLTIIILIFAEVAPKTIAALHPEKIAFPASYIYIPLLKLLYPFVWVVNRITNILLRLLRISSDHNHNLSLSNEELRTVVIEAGAMIPGRHQKMLLSILDLENVTVEDIMIPRNEITGIDIEDEWEEISKQITSSQYTKLPVYKGSIDKVIGFVHLRKIAHLLTQGEFHKDDLLSQVREPYFVPEGTPLNKQLLNFQRNRHRIGLVVDEYGELMGLITLEDILEEIVGEFTTDPANLSKEVHPQKDGSYLIDGTAHIRVLNRMLSWELPTDGPKTINGLILEYMEDIPEPGTSLLLSGHPVEIVQTKDNIIKTVRIDPKLELQQDNEEI